MVVETDGEDLLLSLLRTSADDLHSFIQRERLRWLVFAIALSARTGLVLVIIKSLERSA